MNQSISEKILITTLVPGIWTFQETGSDTSSNSSNSTFYDQSYPPSASNSGSMNKYNTLLRTGTIGAFRDSVLMIIDDYKSYLKYSSATNQYSLNEDTYFQLKNFYSKRVYRRKSILMERMSFTMNLEWRKRLKKYYLKL